MGRKPQSWDRGPSNLRQGLVVKQTLGGLLAEHPQPMRAEHQQVVAAQIDDKCHGSDHAELEHLPDEDIDRPSSTIQQRRSVCRHKMSLAAKTGRR